MNFFWHIIVGNIKCLRFFSRYRILNEKECYDHNNVSRPVPQFLRSENSYMYFTPSSYIENKVYDFFIMIVFAGFIWAEMRERVPTIVKFPLYMLCDFFYFNSRFMLHSSPGRSKISY